MLEAFEQRGIYFTEDEYRTGIRSLFSEEYEDFTHEELEDIILDRIAQMSPSEAEGFFSSIGNYIQKKIIPAIAPIITAALPVVATAAGGLLGGPAGMALGGMVGKFASDGISGATKTKPNPFVANLGQAASSIASGNYQGTIPNLINTSRDIGNAVSPGSGNRVANIASNFAQGAASIAGRNYQGAIPNFMNVGRDIGNSFSAGAGNRFASGISNIAQTASSLQGNNSIQATTQLLNFLQSTPFLQSMLSSLATGNLGTGLQILKEDYSTFSTSFPEMLEALKYLTENALIEADNAGFSPNLALESEADKDFYIESLVEDISGYENSLLPNYDTHLY